MTRVLIHDFFNDAMPMPIVTCVPSAKAYAHYTVSTVWSVGHDEHKHEINISSAYLDRGLEYITSSVIHELTHYYCDTVLNVQDTSNHGVYHNRKFKEEAEKRGLICPCCGQSVRATKTVNILCGDCMIKMVEP